MKTVMYSNMKALRRTILAAVAAVATGAAYCAAMLEKLRYLWDEKIAHEDRTVDGKPIHVFHC